MVTGCGDKHAGDGATQVAARVNDYEISVDQVNQVMQNVGQLAPEQARRAASEVLERIIDQELLVEQAKDRKLDRTVAVLQAVESAKRQIYSRAYLDEIMSKVAKPETAEIVDFYVKNPDLFSRRKIYTIEELGVQPDPDAVSALQQRVAAAKGLDEVAAWLRDRGIPYQSSVAIKPAEQLPLDVIPRLANMKPGDITTLTASGGSVVVRIVDARAQPLDLKAATPLVEQIITTQRQTQVAQAELKRLRSDSTIEYEGEFANAHAARNIGDGTDGKELSANPQETKRLDDMMLNKGAAGLK